MPPKPRGKKMNKSKRRIMLETEAKLRVQEDILQSVAAERIIAVIQHEPFDYTSWQRALWDDKSIEEISRMAAEQPYPR